MLDEVEAERKVHPSAVAAFRLLMLTGCRRNEILTLRWEDVDLDAGELRLRDAKSGPRAVALSPPARRVFATLPRLPDNPWVIAGVKPGARLSNLNNAGLDDVRIHDLRHSFASRALALGESLPMIGKLLGHRKVQTTARYARIHRQPLAQQYRCPLRAARGLDEDAPLFRCVSARLLPGIRPGEVGRPLRQRR